MTPFLLAKKIIALQKDNSLTETDTCFIQPFIGDLSTFLYGPEALWNFHWKQYWYFMNSENHSDQKQCDGYINFFVFLIPYFWYICLKNRAWFSRIHQFLYICTAQQYNHPPPTHTQKAFPTMNSLWTELESKHKNARSISELTGGRDLLGKWEFYTRNYVSLILAQQ